MARDQITLTTGVSGSGKSYTRCARFIVNEWLPDHDGVLFTNYPIGLVPDDHPFPPNFPGETFIDRIAELAEKRHKIPQDETRLRLHLIPEEELRRWMEGSSGPWRYFRDLDLNGAHIAIDEIHNFCPEHASSHIKRQWGTWIGELRHQGCTVEFLTQHLNKLAKTVKQEADFGIKCKSTKQDLDPFFRIPLGDWYELIAAFTRKYSFAFVELHQAKNDNNRWETRERKVFPAEPKYFALYDSHSAPHKGGVKGTKQKHQYERRSRLGVVLWFFARHPFTIGIRFAFIAFLCWLFLFGGGATIMQTFMSVIRTALVTSQDQTKSATSAESNPADSASPEKQGVSESRPSQGDELPAEASATPARSRLVGITPTTLYFRDGRKISLGESITQGPRTYTLERIDHDHRKAFFNGGFTLTLPLHAPDPIVQQQQPTQATSVSPLRAILR